MRQQPTQDFTDLEKHLLNDFQHNFPLSERPFAEIAELLDSDEETVIETYNSLKERGIVSRIGPVFRPNRIGVSTLAAMAIAESDLENIARQVSEYAEVNHNYQRAHRFNLWFVVTASNRQQLQQVLQDIEIQCGYPVMDLPMLEDFFIDLGFDLKWT